MKPIRKTAKKADNHYVLFWYYRSAWLSNANRTIFAFYFNDDTGEVYAWDGD